MATAAPASLWYLRNVDLLRAIREDEVANLAQHTRLVRFERGAHVCMSGTAHTVVYLIKEGNVRAIAHAPNGKRLTVAILGPGELIGEMAIMGADDEPGMSAEAMTGCVLYEIPIDLLQQVVLRRPDVALAITKMAGERQNQIINRLQDVLFLTVQERLARLLLRLADDFPGTTKLGRRFINLRLTHHELADLVGANREAVSATLAKLKRDGSAQQVKGHIVLTDEDKLQAIAHRQDLVKVG